MPLKARGGTPHQDFANPRQNSVMGLRRCRILAADSFRLLVESIVLARKQQKPIDQGLGARHPMRPGSSATDLMRRGPASAFALNGSAAIHDFEIGWRSQTSEDVDAVLPDSSFGSARNHAK